LPKEKLCSTQKGYPAAIRTANHPKPLSEGQISRTPELCLQ